MKVSRWVSGHQHESWSGVAQPLGDTRVEVNPLGTPVWRSTPWGHACVQHFLGHACGGQLTSMLVV